MEENHFFACRIRNQRTFCLWNPESLALESRKYSSRNRINHSSLPPAIQNPESKTLLDYMRWIKVDLLDQKYSINRVSTAYSCAKSVKILRSVSRKLILLILIQGYFSSNFVINQYYALLARRSSYENTTRYSKQHVGKWKKEFSIFNCVNYKNFAALFFFKARFKRRATALPNSIRKL